jgi:hypothetical protein
MLWSSGEAEVGDAKSLILKTRGISGDFEVPGKFEALKGFEFMQADFHRLRTCGPCISSVSPSTVRPFSCSCVDVLNRMFDIQRLVPASALPVSIVL